MLVYSVSWARPRQTLTHTGRLPSLSLLLPPESLLSAGSMMPCST